MQVIITLIDFSSLLGCSHTSKDNSQQVLHQVQEGESLWAIARHYRTSMSTIA